MNSHFAFPILAAAALAASPILRAAPTITVRGTATVSSSQVILDLTADTGGAELRGFGVGVTYNPAAITLQSAGSYGSLWFLRGGEGLSLPYTDFQIAGAGAVTVIGGRFDGKRPDDGVGGESILLGTLVFQRVTGSNYKFDMTLANPSPFSNFTTAAGDPLDANVIFASIQIADASVDTDSDHLPDNYENSTFGNLATSNGTSDTDGDGESDLDEYIGGTNPKDPASKSGFELVIQADDSKLLRWHGSLARVYDILWSPDLGPFQTLHAGIPGTAALLQRLDDFHGTESKGFYRLRTEFPTGWR